MASRIRFDNDDEEALFEARESWVPVILAVIPVALLGILACVGVGVFAAPAEPWMYLCVVAGVVVLALMVVIPRAIDNWRTDAVVTNRRFYYRRGILDVRDHVCDLDSITDITVDPGLVGRIFGYADVRIQTKAGDDDFVLHDIVDAYDMRKVIHTRKDERGVS